MEVLRGDKEVVLKAVRNDGFALEFASDNMRADKDVVLEVVRKNGLALQLASADLQADKDVVLEAVRKNGLALRHASADLQADKDVVLEAVRGDGCALEHASNNLRADNEVVLEAVRKSGLALQYASVELMPDKEELLCLAARNEKRRLALPLDMGYWIRKAGIDEKTFCAAVNCPIAMQGKACPIVTVSLSSPPAKRDIDGNVRVPEPFRCSCNLMSGFSIECAVKDYSCKDGLDDFSARYGSTLDDLARTIVDNLRDHIKTTERVFIVFDVDTENVTPWDWNRPLSDFLPRLARRGTEN